MKELNFPSVRNDFFRGNLVPLHSRGDFLLGTVFPRRRLRRLRQAAQLCVRHSSESVVLVVSATLFDLVVLSIQFGYFFLSIVGLYSLFGSIVFSAALSDCTSNFQISLSSCPPAIIKKQPPVLYVVSIINSSSILYILF